MYNIYNLMGNTECKEREYYGKEENNYNDW